MKISSNCTLLAAALSLTYRSYDPNGFHPADGTSLEAFLDQNGILLTMCMRYRGFIPWLECTRKDNDSKLSASWIQANKTRGFHVIGKPIDWGPPVGLVLQPTATSICCIYPADAATDGRDSDGCGPLSQDARFGSKGYDHAKWYRKLLLRENIISYKNTLFGANRTWESIPCAEFFMPLPSNDTDQHQPAVVGLVEPGNGEITSKVWKYETSFEYTIDQWSHTMGHPVCNQSVAPPKPNLDNDDQYLIYAGPDSWQPGDWTTSILPLMEDTLDQHPSLGVWNELVLNVPSSEEDFVHAVFFIKSSKIGVVMEEIARRVAQREATRLQKPLFYIDLDRITDGEETAELFQCFSDIEEQQHQPANDSYLTISTGADSQI